MVVQAITASVNRTVPVPQIQAALQTLQAWMNIFPAESVSYSINIVQTNIFAVILFLSYLSSSAS